MLASQCWALGLIPGDIMWGFLVDNCHLSSTFSQLIRLFLCWLSFHCSFVLICHRPLTCGVALTRQHIIIYLLRGFVHLPTIGWLWNENIISSFFSSELW